jgi:hypothetical protein
LSRSPITTSKMISFEQQFFVLNTDGGEFVHFSGQLHVVTTVFQLTRFFQMIQFIQLTRFAYKPMW